MRDHDQDRCRRFGDRWRRLAGVCANVGCPIPSVLPKMDTISPSNAAGVLQYCVSRDLVSSTTAAVVLDKLTKKPDVTKSRDFAAGASGQILGDKSFAIGSAPGHLQSQACDLVLKRAKHTL